MKEQLLNKYKKYKKNFYITICVFEAVVIIGALLLLLASWIGTLVSLIVGTFIAACIYFIGFIFLQFDRLYVFELRNMEFIVCQGPFRGLALYADEKLVDENNNIFDKTDELSFKFKDGKEVHIKLGNGLIVEYEGDYLASTNLLKKEAKNEKR